jgi:acyl-CoA reductase-like NAD-dependent aldehyde dehydrogenase
VTAQASFNPRNGLVVPAPAPDTPEAVDAVVATAAAAAEPMAAVPPATRASWLTAIADEAMAGARRARLGAAARRAVAGDQRAVGIAGRRRGAVRWVRPVAFQDVPPVALPAAPRDDNPWRVARRVDGVAE